MFRILRKFISLLKRPILFNTVTTDPVSRDFGLSRGTPIDRFYIDQFLESHTDDFRGTAMEISENTYLKKYNKSIKNFEILHYDTSNKHATIVGDLTRIETLPSNRIDCFVCTQTLNFIFEIEKAVEGTYHVLSFGGVFLGTVSGISQISRYDMDRWGDYWRFTDLSIKKIFEKYYGEGNVEVTIFGNVLAAELFLKGISVEDFDNSSLLLHNDRDYQVTLGIRAIKRAL